MKILSQSLNLFRQRCKRMANDTSRECYFNNNPCIWLKIVGSVALAVMLILVPFCYSQSVQIAKNTDKIVKIETMQTELRSNTEAIIRMTVVLEGMQKSLSRLEMLHSK